jgi:hypothetical protein
MIKNCNVFPTFQIFQLKLCKQRASICTTCIAHRIFLECVCVRVCVCVCMYYVCMYVCIYVRINVCVRMYVLCMYVCMYVCVYMCAYACTYKCVRMYVCIYVRIMHACVNMYVCIYICTQKLYIQKYVRKNKDVVQYVFQTKTRLRSDPKIMSICTTTSLLYHRCFKVCL